MFRVRDKILYRAKSPKVCTHICIFIFLGYILATPFIHRGTKIKPLFISIFSIKYCYHFPYTKLLIGKSFPLTRMNVISITFKIHVLI
jgi:hypothetical protein